MLEVPDQRRLTNLRAEIRDDPRLHKGRGRDERLQRSGLFVQCGCIRGLFEGCCRRVRRSRRVLQQRVLYELPGYGLGTALGVEPRDAP